MEGPRLESTQTSSAEPKEESQILTNQVEIKQNMTSGGNAAFHNFK